MKSKALLVGINHYPHPENVLQGCINDIEDMHTFITTKHPIYSNEDIKMLKDHHATKQNIKEQLQWLIHDLSSGDQILFHYSGHGAQLPSIQSDIEKDGKDEIICPYDFDWTAATTFRDKEFASLFKLIPEGVHFVWISDSCHAGDLSKLAPKPIPNTKYRVFNPHDAFTTQVQLKTLSHGKLSGALLSACGENQLSADAYIDNRYNGAFTYFLLKNLEAHGTDKPMNELITLIQHDLIQHGFDQIPQIEGTMQQMPFFK